LPPDPGSLLLYPAVGLPKTLSFVPLLGRFLATLLMLEVLDLYPGDWD